MPDPNGANDRQQISRQFAKFASRPYLCPSVVKNLLRKKRYHEIALQRSEDRGGN
jgi:hypothetical protein